MPIGEIPQPQYDLRCSQAKPKAPPDCLGRFSSSILLAAGWTIYILWYTGLNRLLSCKRLRSSLPHDSWRLFLEWYWMHAQDERFPNLRGMFVATRVICLTRCVLRGWVAFSIGRLALFSRRLHLRKRSKRWIALVARCPSLAGEDASCEARHSIACRACASMCSMTLDGTGRNLTQQAM